MLKDLRFCKSHPLLLSLFCQFCLCLSQDAFFILLVVILLPTCLYCVCVCVRARVCVVMCSYMWVSFCTCLCLIHCFLWCTGVNLLCEHAYSCLVFLSIHMRPPLCLRQFASSVDGKGKQKREERSKTGCFRDLLCHHRRFS